MDINISRFVAAHSDAMEQFSDSVMNSGLSNIGQVTWRNACEAMADESNWLCSDLDVLTDHFSEYGAMEREELNAMDGQALNALLVQFVAGDYQGRAEAEEKGELDHWEDTEGGRLFVNDAGEWFYYLGC